MIRLLILAAVMIGISGCDDVPDPSPPNEPPVARNDTYSITQNETIVVNVLDNDTDIDGDLLEIEITTDVSNGTLENNNGILVYSPTLYFIGNDSFEYRITDRVGNTASASVSIEILKKEVRAVFSVLDGGIRKVYALDSREPTILVDLGQAIPAGNILAWAISEPLQQAVFLTDANRIVTVALDTPTDVVADYAVDISNGDIDGGFALSNDGNGAILTLDNRFLVAVNLLDGTNELLDSGFENGSTMSPQFFSRLDTSLVMSGTLGTGAEERSAIYLLFLNPTGTFQVLDQADSLAAPFTRLLGGLNSMLWLTADTATDVPPAAYSCIAPPQQIYSAPFYTELSFPGPGNNLLTASSLLADPVTSISYNNAAATATLFVTACSSGDELFQIVQIPYLSPQTARVLATADDASDGLWNMDVAPSGARLVYTLEGDNGLRVNLVDLSGTDPVVTELTMDVPGYQTYVSDMQTQIPPSVLSTDELRWVFLEPVADELTKLSWLQLEGEGALTTLDLPFVATNLLSDGLFALVQGPTGTEEAAPIALIELSEPEVTPVNVAGTLEERVVDPLNQIESAIRLIRAP